MMASQNYYPKPQLITNQRQVDESASRSHQRRSYEAQRLPYDTANSRRHGPHDPHPQTVSGHRPSRDTQGHAHDTSIAEGPQQLSYGTQQQSVDSQWRPRDTQRPTHDTPDSHHQRQLYDPQRQPRDRQGRVSDPADINNQPQSYDPQGQPRESQLQLPITEPRSLERDTYGVQREQADTRGKFYDSQWSPHDTAPNSYQGPSSGAWRPPHDTVDTTSSTFSIPAQTQSFVQTSPVSGPHQRPHGEDLTDRICILTIPGGTFPLTLANSAFSDVFKGKLSAPAMADASTIFVAVKIFRVSTKEESKQTASDVNRRLIRESDVWLKLRHPNIQPYLGHCSNLGPLGQSIGLVSPLCSNGTILDYIGKNPLANRLQLVKDIIRGLQYLDVQDIVHGDLHCNNVLVTEAGSAVLADFGRAKVIGKAGFSTTMFVGHTSYMAPELLPPDDSVDRDKQFSKKSDIYAFGMLCFEAFTNTAPFSSYNVSQDYQIPPLVHNGKRPKATSHVQKCMPNNMWRVMEACWKTTPEDRPSAEQIIQHMH